MLILNRKAKETIIVNGPAVITVVSTTENRVKIGIEANRDVRILRGELLDDDREAA